MELEIDLVSCSGSALAIEVPRGVAVGQEMAPLIGRSDEAQAAPVPGQETAGDQQVDQG